MRLRFNFMIDISSVIIIIIIIIINVVHICVVHICVVNISIVHISIIHISVVHICAVHIIVAGDARMNVSTSHSLTLATQYCCMPVKITHHSLKIAAISSRRNEDRCQAVRRRRRRSRRRSHSDRQTYFVVLLCDARRDRVVIEGYVQWLMMATGR